MSVRADPAPLVSPGVIAPVEGVLGAIGSTPLVRLRRYLAPARVRLFAKLESANPGGSAKDRPAARMLRDALEAGLIAPGSTIVESSSGNMGIGLAQACRYLGLNLICVVDARAREASVRAMRAYGAEVRVVSRPDPATGDLLAARLDLVRRLLRTVPGAWWPNQYANPGNPAAHATGTMGEIDDALGGRIDHLLVATSSAGTLSGCAQELRRRGRTTEVIAVDARGSVLFDGRRATRRVPGLGAGVATPLSLTARHDHLVRVDDLDCVVGCRRLVAREAILAGGSSGGVMTALDRVSPRLRPGSTCVVILPDGGSGYLDTVYDDAWVRDELGTDPAELRALVEGASGSERVAAL